MSLKLGVDPEVGLGDSGVLSTDLTALFVAIGEAAREEQSAVLIAIDELQYLNEEQLSAIIMAVHRIAQLALPLLVVGTGLPQLPALAGNASRTRNGFLIIRSSARYRAKMRMRRSGSLRSARA